MALAAAAQARPCVGVSLSNQGRVKLEAHPGAVRLAAPRRTLFGNCQLQRQVSTPRAAAAVTTAVKAAKREEELKELRQLTDEEIKANVQDLKGELFILRAMQATRQELKTSDFRRIRKRIARMLTVRRERELEQGINKRQSRKIDRAWQRSIVYRAPPSYEAKLKEMEAKSP